MAAFVGTKRLTRLALRRDRILLPASLALVLAISAGSIPALSSAYPDQASYTSYVLSSVPSVVGRLFQGTVQGANFGSIVMAELFLFTAVILAIISIFIVTRHTRYNEETGAGELIGSGVTGRSSPLTAAFLVALATNVIFAILMFLALFGVSELDHTGSALFSASLAMIGIFFAGVGAVAAQLSDYRRGANMIAITVLAVSFLVRGIGDAMGEVSADGLTVTATWVTWLSPLGWGYQTLPFTENRFFPLAILFVATLVVVGVSYYLLGARDQGSSIFQSRPGHARAQAALLKTRGLPKKLMRAGYWAWMAGFVVSGLMVGVLVNDFRSTFEENEAFQSIISASGSDVDFSSLLISSMFGIMASILAGYIVTSMTKMQDEEASGRLEYILTTALSRVKWVWGYVGTIVAGTVISLLVMGVVGGISYVVTLDGASSDISFIEVVGAALASVPAMLVFMSVVLLVFALVGRFVKVAAWLFFAYCALIGSLAGIFDWPQWASNFSPFVHTPATLTNDFEWLPILVMLAVSTALIGLSLVMFRRRDLVLK